MTITIKEETITPAQAREILATSYGNRKLKQNAILEYAVHIEKGTWSSTASKIVIDEKGRLIDGHHRLEACLLANKAFTTQVHRGVPTTDRDVIDTGNKRSLNDLFTMYTNKQNVNTYNAAMNQCVALLFGEGGSRPRVNTLEVAKKWQALFAEGLDYCVDFAVKNQGSGTDRYKKKMMVGFICGAFAFAYKRNPSAVKQFFKQVALGENISAKDPAYTIRQMIMNMVNPVGRPNRFTSREVPWKILAGLYCYIKDQPFSKAQISREAVEYFRDAYDNAQVQNIMAPYLKLTEGREADAKKLAESVKVK